MKRKIFSFVMVLILVLGASAVNVSAMASFDPIGHSCSLTTQSHIDYDQVFAEEGVPATNTSDLKDQPGYEGFLSSNQTYPFDPDQTTELPRYSFNEYVAVTQENADTAIVHYIDPYKVDGVAQELSSIYIKAGNGVYLVTFDTPLKAGKCAQFEIQDFTNNFPAVSHFMTCNANFVPPECCAIYGWKFCYDAYLDSGEDIPFKDRIFNFTITSGDNTVATARSTPDGSLEFTTDGVLYSSELTLPLGEYVVTEDPYLGYEVAATKLEITGVDEFTPTPAVSPSITINTASMHDFTFTFYNKKSVCYTNESAWAKGPNTLNSIKGINANKWGWYIPVDGVSANGKTYDVYAGAGQNDISKGTLIGTVELKVADGKYTAEFIPTFLHKITRMHLGVYSSLDALKATGGAPGQFTNKIPASDAKYIVIHFDAQVAHYYD